MEIADEVEGAADRLGLTIDGDDGLLCIERHGGRLQLDAHRLVAPELPRHRHRVAAWIFVGARLALDKLASGGDDDVSSPMSFRRTSVRHYHEAPSVHGDRLPLLVPRLTRRYLEAGAGVEAFRRPWLQTDLETLIIRESGRRLESLTDAEQRDADLSADKRWEKVRSALFYQSYKVRPRQTVDVAGGRLRIFSTREGFGASRALLLPDFDYDAARDHGYLAVPTRDQIIVARPDNRQSAVEMLPALRQTLRSAIDDATFGLTDALFALRADDVTVHTDPSFELDAPDDRPDRRLRTIDPPP